MLFVNYIKRRIRVLRQKLQEDGVDIFVLTDPCNIFYLSGFKPSAPSFYLVRSDDRPVLYASPLDSFCAKKQAVNCLVGELSLSEEPESFLQKELMSLKLKRIYTDAIDTKLLAKLRKSGLTVRQKRDILLEMRTRKDKFEVGCIKKAAEIAELCLEKITEMITPGISERELTAEINSLLIKLGTEAHAFNYVVVSGSNTVFPHGRFTDRKIKSGDFVTIDIGAVYRGYHSDITRTFIVRKASSRQLRYIDCLIKAQQLAFKSIRADMSAKKLDKTVRKYLAKRRLASYFIHGLGHGLGLEIHEPPYLSPRSKDKLPQNSVFTLEPGIYVERYSGARIEDIVLLSEEGPCFLTEPMHQTSSFVVGKS